LTVDCSQLPREGAVRVVPVYLTDIPGRRTAPDAAEIEDGRVVDRDQVLERADLAAVVGQGSIDHDNVVV
jgi:hypothetical protein